MEKLVSLCKRRGFLFQSSEIYGGLNYYICGHRLKLQTGLSYTVLNDASIERGEYHSWQWVSALRVSW